MLTVGDLRRFLAVIGARDDAQIFTCCDIERAKDDAHWDNIGVNWGQDRSTMLSLREDYGRDGAVRFVVIEEKDEVRTMRWLDDVEDFPPAGIPEQESPLEATDKNVPHELLVLEAENWLLEPIGTDHGTFPRYFAERLGLTPTMRGTADPAVLATMRRRERELMAAMERSVFGTPGAPWKRWPEPSGLSPEQLDPYTRLAVIQKTKELLSLLERSNRGTSPNEQVMSGAAWRRDHDYPPYES